jgi:hypothetical protein
VNPGKSDKENLMNLKITNNYIYERRSWQYEKKKKGGENISGIYRFTILNYSSASGEVLS